MEKRNKTLNQLYHLARKQLLSGVSVDVRAEKNAPGERFTTVGANVGQRRTSPVLQQFGRWRVVGAAGVCCSAALWVIFGSRSLTSWHTHTRTQHALMNWRQGQMTLFPAHKNGFYIPLEELLAILKGGLPLFGMGEKASLVEADGESSRLELCGISSDLPGAFSSPGTFSSAVPSPEDMMLCSRRWYRYWVVFMKLSPQWQLWRGSGRLCFCLRWVAKSSPVLKLSPQRMQKNEDVSRTLEVTLTMVGVLSSRCSMEKPEESSDVSWETSAASPNCLCCLRWYRKSVVFRKHSPHTVQRCRASSKPCWVLRCATSSDTNPKHEPQSTHRRTGSGLGFLEAPLFLGDESSALAAEVAASESGSELWAKGVSAAGSLSFSGTLFFVSGSDCGSWLDSLMRLDWCGFNSDWELWIKMLCSSWDSGCESGTGMASEASCWHFSSLRCCCHRCRLLKSSSQSPHW